MLFEKQNENIHDQGQNLRYLQHKRNDKALFVRCHDKTRHETHLEWVLPNPILQASIVAHSNQKSLTFFFFKSDDHGTKIMGTPEGTLLMPAFPRNSRPH